MSLSPEGTVTPTTGRSLYAEKVTALAQREPLLIESGTTVVATIRRMRAARGEPALIMRDGRLEGIFTERDVLLKVLGHDVPRDAPVDAYMKPRPETLTGDATLGEAAHLMDRGRFRHVPILDTDGQPVLTLRQQDILAYIAEAFPEEILNLPPRPHQLMGESEGA